MARAARRAVGALPAPDYFEALREGERFQEAYRRHLEFNLRCCAGHVRRPPDAAPNAARRIEPELLASWHLSSCVGGRDEVDGPSQDPSEPLDGDMIE